MAQCSQVSFNIDKPLKSVKSMTKLNKQPI